MKRADIFNHPSLDSINWKEIANLYKVMGWAWLTKVPDEYDLRREAAALVKDLLDNPSFTNVGTGRITAVKMPNNHIFIFFGHSNYLGPFDDIMMNEALE